MNKDNDFKQVEDMAAFKGILDEYIKYKNGYEKSNIEKVGGIFSIKNTLFQKYYFSRI